ncbi:hypothetical protein ILT44_27360 [Microvirga sp. BT689]|uniref:hypothetical protein n=1 Tax=Microvirga arvi TaxID=2778731 RepID=UPI00194FF605|nr:hypothetical protein [Microvirga arvi]MBM6583925.1 hypothetical protein [Microvirga arvi]
MAADNDITLSDYAKAARNRAAKRTRDAAQVIGAFALSSNVPGRCDFDPSLMMGVILHGLSVCDTPETREVARAAGAQALAQLAEEIDKGLNLPQPKLMMAVLETEPTEELKRQLEDLEFRPFKTQSPLPHYVGWATAAKLKPILQPVGGTMAPYKPPGGWLARAAIQPGAEGLEGEEVRPGTDLGPSTDDPSTSLISTEIDHDPAKVIEALSDPQFNGTSSGDHTDEELSRAELQSDAATSVTRHARSGGPQGTDAPPPLVTGNLPPATRARRDRNPPPVQPSLAGSRARGVG